MFPQLLRLQLQALLLVEMLLQSRLSSPSFWLALETTKIKGHQGCQRDHPAWDWKEAKALVDGAPANVKEDVEKAEAEEAEG